MRLASATLFSFFSRRQKGERVEQLELPGGTDSHAAGLGSSNVTMPLRVNRHRQSRVTP